MRGGFAAKAGGGSSDGHKGRFGSFLRSVEMFDSEPFGLSGSEAVRLDPQQRILLTRALVLQRLVGSTVSSPASVGVFVGIAAMEYSTVAKAGSMPLSPHTSTGSALSVASGRISYTLGFQGPAMSVDTACSSSLVAAHLGHGSLLSGKSSDAVVAGSHLTLDPYGTAAFITSGMLAEDGRCKTLDSMADGYVRGDGCGMLLLQDADEDAVWRPCAAGACDLAGA